MFALLAPSILSLCIAIWHKEANYTEECVGSINLHDVTKCNKNEGISKKKKNELLFSAKCALSCKWCMSSLSVLDGNLASGCEKATTFSGDIQLCDLASAAGQSAGTQGHVRLMGHMCAHSRS